MSERPPRNDRPAGQSMVLFYLILCGGFVVANVMWPEVMARRVRETVTVAVAYGVLLIVAGAIVALLYVRRLPR